MEHDSAGGVSAYPMKGTANAKVLPTCNNLSGANRLAYTILVNIKIKLYLYPERGSLVT